MSSLQVTQRVSCLLCSFTVCRNRCLSSPMRSMCACMTCRDVLLSSRHDGMLSFWFEFGFRSNGISASRISLAASQFFDRPVTFAFEGPGMTASEQSWYTEIQGTQNTEREQNYKTEILYRIITPTTNATRCDSIPWPFQTPYLCASPNSLFLC
jgi:hypothetical protein